MPNKSRSHARKKASKVTMKSHRKAKGRRTKDDWQKLFRERFFV